MPNYEEIIQQSQENVKALSEKLKELDKLHEDIKKLIELPETFDDKFQEIVELTENYTNTLGSSTKKYLDGNNTLFTTKLSELSEKTKELQKEITRLSSTDFKNLFKELQKDFIDKTRKDLAIELEKFDIKLNELSGKTKDLEKQITRLLNTDFKNLFKELQKEFIDKTKEDLEVELKKFDEKSKDVQNKINNLNKIIERLEKIDLEKHFAKLQKTLSEIFEAINSINLTLTTITQALNSIVQSLGEIKNAIDTNHKETKQIISSFSAATEKHLKDQDKQSTRNNELVENKLISLAEQNELLRKSVKTNRIIQLIGIAVVIIILVYVVIR